MKKNIDTRVIECVNGRDVLFEMSWLKHIKRALNSSALTLMSIASKLYNVAPIYRRSQSSQSLI